MPQTTVFQSGNSQAVRLPKEFRFKSKTVEIFRRGDEVVLREKPQTLKDLLDSWPPLSPEEDQQFALAMAEARDRRPAQERDWAALWGDDALEAPAQPKSRKRPKRPNESRAKPALRRKVSKAKA